MGTTRVVLAVEPSLFSEVLRLRLEKEWGLEVVDVVFDPFDLLLSVAETDADAVVLTVSEPAQTPAIHTHLFAEFPQLLVIGVCSETNQAYVYRGPLDYEQLPDVSLEHLVVALRDVDDRIQFFAGLQIAEGGPGGNSSTDVLRVEWCLGPLFQFAISVLRMTRGGGARRWEHAAVTTGEDGEISLLFAA